MDELSLSLVNMGPTYNSSSRDTRIDKLSVDQCRTVVNSSRVSLLILSRHDIISVTIKLILRTISSNSVTYRNFAKVAPQDITSYPRNCDWSLFSVPDCDFDLEQGLLARTDSIHGAVDHLAPEKTFQPKKSMLLWVDAKIRLLICRPNEKPHYLHIWSKSSYLYRQIRKIFPIQWRKQNF